jgi:hypothetical protein
MEKRNTKKCTEEAVVDSREWSVFKFKDGGLRNPHLEN